MLCIYGSPLYQWDINRQLKIDTVDLNSDFLVHCCHSDDASTLVVEPIIDGDSILVNIPNILLQRSGYIRVYVVIEGDTVYDASFYVMARPKPDDYVYTETEVYTIKTAVEKALLDAKESGEFDGVGITSIRFDSEDRLIIEMSDGHALFSGSLRGKDGINGKSIRITSQGLAEDGTANYIHFSDNTIVYLPRVRNPVRGTDYWTDTDKAEMVQDVLAALPDGDEVEY